jgi:hypothetical protein
MNKKVMALAVASVLAAPAAFAQSSNVQLYGRAVLGSATTGQGREPQPHKDTAGVNSDRDGRITFSTTARASPAWHRGRGAA